MKFKRFLILPVFILNLSFRAQENEILFEDMAQRVEPNVSWEDLTLPRTQLFQLKNICNQARRMNRTFRKKSAHRNALHAKGLNVLFCGCSEGEKTMAAEVIASELERVLYRIDLGVVVSKYIGETEKT